MLATLRSRASCNATERRIHGGVAQCRFLAAARGFDGAETGRENVTR